MKVSGMESFIHGSLDTDKHTFRILDRHNPTFKFNAWHQLLMVSVFGILYINNVLNCQFDNVVAYLSRMDGMYSFNFSTSLSTR